MIPKVKKKLMELYGNCESTFFGINEKGEDIELHISNNEISKSIISPITIKSTSLCAHIYWIGDFAISEKITITTIFFISLWVKLGANHLSVVCPSVSGSYVTVSVGQ